MNSDSPNEAPLSGIYRSHVGQQSFFAMKNLTSKVEGLRVSDLLDTDIHGDASTPSDGDLDSPTQNHTGNLDHLSTNDDVTIDIRRGHGPNKQYLTMKHRGTITDMEGVQPALELQSLLDERSREVTSCEKNLYQLREAKQKWEVRENVLLGQVRSRQMAVDVLRKTLWQDLMALRAVLGFRDERVLERQRKAQKERQLERQQSVADGNLPMVEEDEDPLLNAGSKDHYKGFEFTYLDAFKLLDEAPNEDGSNLEEGTRRLFKILKMEFEREKQWINDRHEKTVAALMLENRTLDEKSKELNQRLTDAQVLLDSSVGNVRQESEKQLKKLIAEAQSHVKSTERSYESKLDSKEETISELRVQVMELRSEVGSNRNEVEQLRADTEEKAEEGMQIANNRILDLEVCVKDRDYELHRARGALGSANKERAELTMEVATLQGEIAELKVDVKKSAADFEAFRAETEAEKAKAEQDLGTQLQDFKKAISDVDTQNSERQFKNQHSIEVMDKLARDTSESHAGMWKEEAMEKDDIIENLEHKVRTYKAELTEVEAKVNKQMVLCDTAKFELEALQATHDVLKSRTEGDQAAAKLALGKIRPMVSLLSKVNQAVLEEALFSLEQLERLSPKSAIGVEDHSDTVRRFLHNLVKRTEVGQLMLLVGIDEFTHVRTMPSISDERSLSEMMDFEFGKIGDAKEVEFVAKEEDKIEAHLDHEIAAYRAKRLLAEETIHRAGTGDEEMSFEDLCKSQGVRSEPFHEDFGSGDDLTAGALDGLDTASKGGKRRSRTRSIKSGKSSRSLAKRKSSALSGGGDSVDISTQSAITWVEAAPALVPGTNKDNSGPSRHKIKLNTKAWMFGDSSSSDEGEGENASRKQRKGHEGGVPVWMQAEVGTMTDDLEDEVISEGWGHDFPFDETAQSNPTTTAGPIAKYNAKGSFLERQAASLQRHHSKQGRPASANSNLKVSDGTPPLPGSSQRRALLHASISGRLSDSKRQSIVSSPMSLSSQHQQKYPDQALYQQRLPDVFTQDAVSVAMNYVHRGIGALCEDARAALEEEADPARESNGSNKQSKKAAAEALIHRWFGTPVNKSVHPFAEKWDNPESLSWLYRRGETMGSSPAFLLDVMEMRVFSLLEAVADQRGKVKESELHRKAPTDTAHGTQAVGLHGIAASVQHLRHRQEDLLQNLKEEQGIAGSQTIVTIQERNLADMPEDAERAQSMHRPSRSALPSGSVGGSAGLLASREMLRRSGHKSHLLPSTIVDLGISETMDALIEANADGCSLSEVGGTRPSSTKGSRPSSAPFSQYQPVRSDQEQVNTRLVELEEQRALLPEAEDQSVESLYQLAAQGRPGSASSQGTIFNQVHGPTILSGDAPTMRRKRRPLSAGPGSTAFLPQGNTLPIHPGQSDPRSSPSKELPEAENAEIVVPGQPQDAKVVYLAQNRPGSAASRAQVSTRHHKRLEEAEANGKMLEERQGQEDLVKYTEVPVVNSKGFSGKNQRVLTTTTRSRLRKNPGRTSVEAMLSGVMRRGESPAGRSESNNTMPPQPQMLVVPPLADAVLLSSPSSGTAHSSKTQKKAALPSFRKKTK